MVKKKIINVHFMLLINIKKYLNGKKKKKIINVHFML